MRNLIFRYGLLGLFVGAVFEGDVTLLLGGVVAHLGLLKLPSTIFVGCLGAVVADCACYLLARTQREMMAQRTLYQHVKPVIDRMVLRVGAWEIVLARFVYGTRIASMFFWGIYGLSFPRFLLFDVIGCALWASLLASLGYAFSSSAEMLIGKTRQVEVWLLVALLATGVGIFALRRGFQRRLDERGHPPSISD